MIVVVGMAFEARIAAGLGARVICSGDGRNLAPTLARAMAAGCGGLISFGVAGGLAPELKPGTCVIGSRIFDENKSARPMRAGRSD
jgi:purine nucleoside phosphorylase